MITVGRFVYYTLTDQDVAAIRSRRSGGCGLGNPVEAGQSCAAQVTAVWSDTCVNLRVILDGTDTFWRTSASQGDGPGTWRWMYAVQETNTTNQKP